MINHNLTLFIIILLLLFLVATAFFMSAFWGVSAKFVGAT